MIRMPHRNVTRFFIPLIDVLILLFCIFLLMEFNSASEVDEQTELIAEKVEDVDQLEAERRRLLRELQKYEELRPKLDELDQLTKEVQRLKNENKQNLLERSYLRVIDIDGKDGSISFYDVNRPDQPVIPIADAKAAQVLIERHSKEAKGRELYYYFMPPRPLRGYPTLGQIRQYKTWFSKVANSLAEKR